VVVRVVEGVRDRGHYLDHRVWRHAIGIAIAQQLGRVGAIDVVHRKPQPALELAPVVQADDVRVPQCCCQVGLPVEPFAILRVGRYIGRQDLERVTARQPRVLGQVELTDLPVPKLSNNAEPGSYRTTDQRHAEDRTGWRVKLRFRVATSSPGWGLIARLAPSPLRGEEAGGHGGQHADIDATVTGAVNVVIDALVRTL
jgi:hypothetical protein